MASTFLPKTREQDQRVIHRSSNKFIGGMYTDIAPNKIPNGALAYIANARSMGDSIRGRSGSVLFSGVSAPYYATGISGVLNVTGYEYPKFLADPGSDIEFTPDMIGHKIMLEEGKFCVIEDVIATKEVACSTNITEIGQYVFNDCSVRGQFNASFFDQRVARTYYLVGNIIYYIESTGIEWKEIPVIGAKPSDTSSSFYYINNELVLVNEEGIYHIVRDIYKTIAVQLNQENPKYKLNTNELGVFAKPSAYNYLYSYSIIDGNVNKNRYDKDNKILLETPPHYQDGDYNEPPNDNNPYVPDDNNNDYTTIYTELPIYDSFAYIFNISNEYKNYLTYKELTEYDEKPFIVVDVNNDRGVCYIDFSNVYSMNDVAKAITFALKQYDVSLECSIGSLGNDEQIIYMYSKTKKHYINFISGSTTGYDGINLIDTGKLEMRPEPVYMGNTVEYLRYPDYISGVTHHTIYRTKDAYPNIANDHNELDYRTQNNPEVFGYIEDVPAVSFFKANLESDGTMTSSEFNRTLVGNVARFADDVTTEIDIISPKSNTEYSYITNYSGTLVDDKALVVGSSDVLHIVSKVHDVITDYTGYAFTDLDIGKVIFYEDGHTDIIISIDGTDVYTSSKRSYSDSYAALNPTSIVFNDHVDDVKQNSNLSINPMNMRFYKPMINATVSAVTNNLLIVAGYLDSFIRYSNTFYLFRAGYYNVAYQYISNILRHVNSMFSINDIICIFTDTETYIINSKQGKVMTTDYGESYYMLPTPIKVSGSIGMRYKDSWTFHDKDKVIVFTSEPAIRLFNGSAYSDDLSNGSIHNTYINKFYTSLIIDYDQVRGTNFWSARSEDGNSI